MSGEAATDSKALERGLIDMAETLRQAMVILEDFEDTSLSPLYSKLNSVVQHAQEIERHASTASEHQVTLAVMQRLEKGENPMQLMEEAELEAMGAEETLQGKLKAVEQIARMLNE